MAESPYGRRARPWLGGLLIAALLLLAGFGYLRLQQEQLLAQQRQSVHEVAAARAFTLQEQLARSLSATYALASVLRQFDGIPDFESLAADMMASFGGLSSLQLAPGGVVRAIHPLAGNERAIGHDLLNDPKRRAEALRAIQTREMTLAGPFELVQGGTAVIGRLPVFDRNGDFWGFTIALIRLPLLLGVAEISHLAEAGLDYELSRINPATGERVRFDSSLTEAIRDPEEVQIAVPNGHWVLGVAPRDGWTAPSLPLEERLLVLLASLISGLLAGTLLRYPDELREQVVRRRASLQAANLALEDEVQARDRIERALRSNETRLRRIIDYAGDSVFVYDTDGRLLNVNREACRLLGYDRDALLAMPMGRIAGAFDREEQRQARDALQPGAMVVQEDRLRRADGERCPVEMRVAVFEEQGRRLHVSFARDITERLAAATVLSRTREELEERVAQRTQALERANASLVDEIAVRREAEAQLRAAMKAAEEASASKSQFLANLSHEIRTPMNGLLGMLNLLADHPLTDEQRDYIETATRSGEGLLQLLNDLLDLARIEAGYLELDPVETELGPWLEACVSGPRDAAADRGLDFTLDLDPALPTWARFDAPRLAQVLFNLLENAVKFTASGKVALRLKRVGQEAAPGLQVTVSDTGIGIPQASLKRVFDAFSQVEETLTRQHEGPGLGLAISSRLVDLMGGRLEVDSAVGVGSCFTFTVPLEACKARVEATERVSGAAMGAPNVLVAEDDHTSQQVILAMLEHLGCQVELAVDGREAVARFAAGRFDLVLMDCRMPELDGIAAAGEMRRLESGGGRRTPILGLSGDTDAATVASCRDAGMDGHLAKPLQVATLRESLARWVACWQPLD